MARIARKTGIDDNLLFNWRHQYRKGGLLPSGKNLPALLPVVTLTPEPDNKSRPRTGTRADKYTIRQSVL